MNTAVRPPEAALPRRPGTPVQRAAAADHRDAAPAHRQRLPLRARRLALRDARDERPVALPRAHAVSRIGPLSQLVRAQPRDRGAGRDAVRGDRPRLFALPDHAAPEAGGARSRDPGRSVRRRPRFATSISNARSSSRRSWRTSTIAAATSTSTTSRAGWRGGDTRSASRSPGRLRNVRHFSLADVRSHFRALLRRRQHGARRRRTAVGARRACAGAGGVRARAAGRRAGGRAAPEPNGRGPRFRAVHNESAQTQVHVLFHALPETDPGYSALRALIRVLDDGMSTRLHYQICDQKGLAYSVAGSLHSYHDAALLEVDAACSHAKLPALVTETLAMLGRFREELVGEDELEKAKRRFVSDVEIVVRRSRRPVRLVRGNRALLSGRPAGQARAGAGARAPGGDSRGRAARAAAGTAVGDGGGRARARRCRARSRRS